MLAGFGKGSFKLLKENEAAPEKAIEFKLSNDEDLICFNGKVLPLGQVVQEQRAKKPEAQVSYHKMVVNDENPKKFSLTTSHRICFVGASGESEPEASIGNIGMKEALDVWAKCPNFVLAWTCRWSAKGLMPVKPSIHLKLGLTVPIGRAYLCSTSES